MNVAQVQYRQLLALAREVDRNAGLRALISTNMLHQAVPGLSTRLSHVVRCNDHLLTYLNNRVYYIPSHTRPLLQTLVRETFRRSKSIDDNADTAFLVLKMLYDRLADAKTFGILSNNPDAKNALSATQAPCDNISIHLTHNISSGIFLLSHPMLGQDYNSRAFKRSVVVLTRYSSEEGARGFIVNQPSKVPLMKRYKVHPRILKAFGPSKVYKGGPVATTQAQILHCQHDLGGQRIVNSNFSRSSEVDLYYELDLETAAKKIEDGSVQSHDIVFLKGMSDWIPQQLEKEIEQGVWIPVKAPLSLAINAERDLWKQMMSRLGGEYQVFSELPALSHTKEDEDDDSDDED